ncbi:ATPase [Aureococcus anophagefferens]|nr:ATPase [Aureococcus anophagefferens]
MDAAVCASFLARCVASLPALGGVQGLRTAIDAGCAAPAVALQAALEVCAEVLVYSPRGLEIARACARTPQPREALLDLAARGALAFAGPRVAWSDALEASGYHEFAEDGSFVWRRGPLAAAAARGDWVLVEDVDRAPVEVLELLKPLARRGVLSAPGRALASEHVAARRLFDDVSALFGETFDARDNGPFLARSATAPPGAYAGRTRRRLRGVRAEPDEAPVAAARQRGDANAARMRRAPPDPRGPRGGRRRRPALQDGAGLRLRLAAHALPRFSARRRSRGHCRKGGAARRSASFELAYATQLVGDRPGGGRRAAADAIAGRSAPARRSARGGGGSASGAAASGDDAFALVAPFGSPRGPGTGAATGRDRARTRALNRLLDDNRELRIPETGEVVRPAPGFALFATQNPAGVCAASGATYGGRKPLTRAFRDRFVEIHVDELSSGELRQRRRGVGGVAPSLAARLVDAHGRLRRLRLGRGRDGGSLFEGSQSLCSLRGVAARGVAPTAALLRLAGLLAAALDHAEPALLVGETGGGKTTACELLAAARGADLVVINCHMHSEASDFLGALRPARRGSGALFEWVDGALVAAMKAGAFVLLDELNLADDAVLERLNSVLEPGRSVTLAEKGGEVLETVVAHADFRVVATMNPGGDHGKRELSPALRSRFTELWAPTRAAKESDIPNFKGFDLGRFPLVSADFWTSDHLLERPRSVDAFSGTRARGTLTLN